MVENEKEKLLLNANELIYILKAKYNIELSYPALSKLRKQGVIPAIDVTLPTSKVSRYKYDLDDVVKKIFALKKEKST